MQIFIRLIDNSGYRYITVVCDPDTSILDIKHKLHVRLNDSIDLYKRYSLRWNCILLQNDKTIHFYGIKKEDIIHLKYMWNVQQ
jgi:hypothetical protein